MKKIVYYISFLLLLFLISIIPTSAKEFKTCARTTTNLRVREYFVRDDNLNAILETPCVDEVDKIYDFADLLTDLEEEELYKQVSNYIRDTNYDLALVTIDDNNKGSARQFAEDFYDYNYFGYTDTRDGSLLLIDMDTRELYLTRTGYAIKMYEDITIDEILDDGYNYIINENYYDTFRVMIQGLENNFQETYPDSNQDLLINEYGEVYYIKHIPYSWVLIIAGIITLIVSLIFYQKSVLKIKAINTISYLKNKNINLRKDHLVNTIVTHTRRSSNTSSGGSGSKRSGSTFHRASSGSSHAGSGRRF